MATSAFKSTSRRGSTSSVSQISPKKAPVRRSHSVSALSRVHHLQLDVTSELLNKRDNPLFWSTGSPPDKEMEPQIAKFAENVTKVSASASTSKTSLVDGQRERGRSVTRSSDVVNKKVTVGGKKDAAGRSLSRVDTGRRGRSVSRGHYAASESELERDCGFSSQNRSKSSSNVTANGVKKANLAKNAADMGRSSDCSALEPSDNSASYLQIPNCEDGICTESLSEAEEKTIRAVCEQMKTFQGDHMGRGDTAANEIYETVRFEVRRAISDIQNDLESVIQRNNATAIAAINVADIPPDLVNPGAVELVLDIRREYARKLEESHERARKLRSDLAVEEHRGQELSRILKEILPDPMANSVQKSRPRNNSSERKKMSKRLTEEAMMYFDECVSISTFDSSDFSAPEDPSLNPGVTTPLCAIAALAQGSPSISSSCCLNSCLNDKQESDGYGLLMHSQINSGITASSSSNQPMINQTHLRGNNAEWGRKLQFSFSQKPTEHAGLQQHIWCYVKNIGKEFDKGGINSDDLKSNYYDTDEALHLRVESFLFDRVLSKNRIDSGSLHLCGGGLPISFSPFASVV